MAFDLRGRDKAGSASKPPLATATDLHNETGGVFIEAKDNRLTFELSGTQRQDGAEPE